MKTIVVFLFAIVLSFTSVAQQWSEVEASKSSRTAASIITAVREVTQMDCAFKQVKTSPIVAQPVVSTGKMHYVSPDKMKWEYESPSNMAIHIDGDKMALFRDGKLLQVSSKQQMGLKSMMKMIVGMSNGSSLFDEHGFDWKLFENKGSYRVEMIPKSKSVKRMFVQVNLMFDKGDRRVIGLELRESDNSVTTITFTK